MVKIHDIRNRTPRTNGKRSISQIKYIARHHSATTSGDFDSFWKTWHGVKGWGTGGYHEIILRDGSVQLCYDPEEITNGVANHNTPTYHICVVGNGSFTNEQEKTFKERCLYNMERLNVPVERVLGHREFSGASTACPGIDMNMVRRNLKLDAVTASTDRDYLIYGDRGDSVKALQKYLTEVGFTVEVSGYYNAATKKAVMKFQEAQGLKVDGVYGKGSKVEMNKALKEQAAVKPATKPKEESTMAEQYKKDAQPSKSLAPEFKEAVKAGITDGTYPQRPVTREEAAVMAYRSSNKK